MKSRMIFLVSILVFLQEVWASEPTLSTCLPSNGGIYSQKEGDREEGFDLYLVEAIARRHKAKLDVTWFEFDSDEESLYLGEVNALIASGLCDFVPGFPLVQEALNAPLQAFVRVPDLLDKRKGGRISVRSVQLLHTKAYHFAPLAIFVHSQVLNFSEAPRDFRALKNLRVGVEEGTLADYLLMTHDRGGLHSALRHYAPETTIFKSLEQGEIDAIVVELHRFDQYREAYGETKIMEAAVLHEYGFEMGMLVAPDALGLLDQLNETLAVFQKNGEMQRIARRAGLTWVVPNYIKRETSSQASDFK